MNKSLTGWNKATVVWRGRANPTGNAALETIFSCTYIHPVYLFYVCGTWFSDCQRFKISSSTGWNTTAACLVRSNKSDWQVERGPPIVNASKWVPQLVGTRQLHARCGGTNPIGNSTWSHIQLHLRPGMYWQASIPDFCIITRDPIEVLSRSDRGPKEPPLLRKSSQNRYKECVCVWTCTYVHTYVRT